MKRSPARSPLQHESGSTLSMTMLAITIVAMIMLFVGAQTMSSIFTTKQKQERSTGMAAADSGIEKLRVALQSHLADEQDGYHLDLNDLNRLRDGQTGTEVIPNNDAGWGMSPVLVPRQYQYTVVERTATSIGYWQVYNVIEPHYMQGRSSDLVIFIRAWATDASSTNPRLTVRPKIFRAEFRPSYFSDYQFVSDAPFWVLDNSNYRISGPIHSNGYEADSTFAVTEQDNAPQFKHSIFFSRSPTCEPGAQFSSSRNKAMTVPGRSCRTALRRAQSDAREINMLGVVQTFEQLGARCGPPSGGVLCVRNAATTRLRLLGNAVEINGVTYPASTWRQGPDSSSLSILTTGDLEVTGSLDSTGTDRVYRLTIANRRAGNVDRAPSIELHAGSTRRVGAVDPSRDSVGIITEGDIVLRMRDRNGPQSDCLQQINVAAISASGSITLPPEWVTRFAPPTRLDNRDCSRPLRLRGSFASHGQFASSLSWKSEQGDVLGPVGYTQIVMEYNKRFYDNPPPYYPTTLPWAMTTVREADARCLTTTTYMDPACGAS